jgi:outer membrane protein OmpA-like peptidoglycan-associated protein
MTKHTAFIFFGIILAGLVGSLIWFNISGKVVETTDGPQQFANIPDGDAPVPDSPGEKRSPASKGKGGKSAAKRGATDPANPVAKSSGAPALVAGKVYASPEAAMKALGSAAGQKDFDTFVNFVGKDAVAEQIRSGVKTIIESPQLKLSAEKPMSEISKSANAVRWALNFVPEAGAEAKQIYADLDVKSKDAFSISQISLPLEMAAIERPEGKPASNDPAALSKPASSPPSVKGVDALTIAHAFSKAVVGRNFKAARALSDPATVTDERVAALMIAIEEGKFQLKDERPLVVTLSRDDITWVLTRVQGEGSGSEFALELGRVEDKWAVNGLTFSKVLAALSDQAGGGNVAYSPIVEDPMGGDSLVLYFEFDQSGLSPRGNRQLAIIADILGQGADRVIRINGHADSMGTDDYNATLSDKRAAAIRRGLISMGVSPRQIVTEAFGETKPRRPNFNPDGSDNPTGRSQNRRAEVYLDF